MKTVAAKSLNGRGQCCGRKPISYKRPRFLFCDRCHAAFDPDDGKQVANWAYFKLDDHLFEVRTSASDTTQDQAGGAA